MPDLAEKIAEAMDKRGWVGSEPHGEQVRDEIRRVIREQETVMVCMSTRNIIAKPRTVLAHIAGGCQIGRASCRERV